MVNFYIRRGGRFAVVPLEAFDPAAPEGQIVWIDMLKPRHEELRRIEALLGIEFPTQQEREEIELSSRYWEDETSIMVNAYFFVSFFFADASKEPYNETVTFILSKNILVSVRYRELKTFEEMERRMLLRPGDADTGYDVFSQIFDIRVDTDADILEYAAKEINALRKRLFDDEGGNSDQILRKISTLQEFNLKIRETVFDKRRTITSLLKSAKLASRPKEELSIMLKDVNSLIEFTTINLNALDNLQNLFLGQINIEQNKIIKIFTVASVAMMPPTLIASIYGMNFRYMPELSWGDGYPFALVMMVVSAVIPLAYFRKRQWL